MPRVWEVPIHLFNYAMNEVATAFYDHTPHSLAQEMASGDVLDVHVASEDVLSRVITPDTIITRKLVVNKG